MAKCFNIRISCFIVFCILINTHVFSGDRLERGFANPPIEARLRAYWWWLNGNVTQAAITRDLEEMKEKGFGGALICDADGSSQDGNDRAKHGPAFGSRPWMELFKHALSEARRLGLEMSLNIQSGWNLGGPMVKPDDAPKKAVWTETRLNGKRLEIPSCPRGQAKTAFGESQGGLPEDVPWYGMY